MALPHQSHQVGLKGMARDSRHGHPHVLAQVAAGERNVQFPGNELGIVIEGFVEVSHAKQDNGALVGILDLEVLASDWCHRPTRPESLGFCNSIPRTLKTGPTARRSYTMPRLNSVGIHAGRRSPPHGLGAMDSRSGKPRLARRHSQRWPPPEGRRPTKAQNQGGPTLSRIALP